MQKHVPRKQRCKQRCCNFCFSQLPPLFYHRAPPPTSHRHLLRLTMGNTSSRFGNEGRFDLTSGGSLSNRTYKELNTAFYTYLAYFVECFQPSPTRRGTPPPAIGSTSRTDRWCLKANATDHLDGSISVSVFSSITNAGVPSDSLPTRLWLKRPLLAPSNTRNITSWVAKHLDYERLVSEKLPTVVFSDGVVEKLKKLSSSSILGCRLREAHPDSCR